MIDLMNEPSPPEQFTTTRIKRHKKDELIPWEEGRVFTADNEGIVEYKVTHKSDEQFQRECEMYYELEPKFPAKNRYISFLQRFDKELYS